jgi:hypothetical protein
LVRHHGSEPAISGSNCGQTNCDAVNIERITISGNTMFNYKARGWLLARILPPWLKLVKLCPCGTVISKRAPAMLAKNKLVDPNTCRIDRRASKL